MTVLDLLRPRTSHAAQQRGWQYLNQVQSLSGDPQRVVAQVRGSEVYDVEIRAEPRELRVWCSCPYFADRSSGCKHLWATAVLATENGWLTSIPADLPVVIDMVDADQVPFGVLDEDEPWSPARPPAAAASKAAPSHDWRAVLQAVTPPAIETPVGRGAASELVYVLTAPRGATLTELPLLVEQRDRKRDGGWTRPHTTRLTLDSIAHLPDENDRWALSLIHSSASYPRTYTSYGYGYTPAPNVTYVKAPLLDLVVPRLCATGRLRLRHAPAGGAAPARSDQDLTLQWDDGQPWRLMLVVTHEGGAAHEPQAAGPGPDGVYRVDAVLSRGDVRASIHEPVLLTDSMVVFDEVVARVDLAGGLAWATQLRARGPLVIPARSSRALVESLARSSIANIEVPDDLQWEERAATPRFAVTIGKPDAYRGACRVDIAVDYDGTDAPMDGGDRLLSADGRVMYRRDRAAERAALETLAALGVRGLESHLRDGASIGYRRVSALVPALVDRGWLVQAEGVRYRALHGPRIRVRSGIDWFEIQTASDDGAEIDLADLLNAAKSGRRMIALGDGTVGMLPEAWLARVAPALALGEADESGVRFKLSQVALIDALLAAQPDVDWDEGFERARDAMQRFEGVHTEDAAETFCGTLREYQREALGWMRFLRDFGFGGCLADDMGLGKTVMVLAMLDARRTDPSRRRSPSLIVMPRSLVFNWTSEAARFAPELRVLDLAHAGRGEAMNDMADADVVLATYGTLRRDIAKLQKHEFDYVVLDEAQAIKNAGTATAKAVRLLRADHRLALTGTPVENHLGELESLFEFLNPGLLGRGRLLDVRRHAGQGGDPHEYVARVAKGLRPFFLRRTKEEVTPELPPRTEETLHCELEGEQRRTYDQLREHYRRTLLKIVARQGIARSKFQILEALLRLRQAACHTGLLPSARAGQSAKFDLLLPRLLEVVQEGRKALVFSQFTSLLGLLKRRLDADRITYEYLDGETRDREARVERFQTDPACPLFLISLKAGGVGLNLTAAEYVFLLDPWWNPAVEAQAIDRTHRIGQDKPVFAYRLVAQGTVEDRILELQSRKRALADAILDAGTGGLRGLQREDLEQLLA